MPCCPDGTRALNISSPIIGNTSTSQFKSGRDKMSNREKNTNLKQVLLVVGARPNFIKVAPIIREFQRRKEESPDFHLAFVLLHTGQHYDTEMSDIFFRHLQIPEPEINLGVGSGSHGAQTAAIMRQLEVEIDRLRPAAVVTFGDVNSTLAASLVVAKSNFGIQGDQVIRPLLVHVEAGLRSFDRDMPEEINRIVADSLSDLLMASTRDGVENLRKEGIPEGKIHFVGNVMIDSLRSFIDKVKRNNELLPGLEEGRFILATVHISDHSSPGKC